MSALSSVSIDTSEISTSPTPNVLSTSNVFSSRSTLIFKNAGLVSQEAAVSRLSHTRGLERDSCCNLLWGGGNSVHSSHFTGCLLTSRESKNACSDQRAGLDKLLMQQVVLLREDRCGGRGRSCWWWWCLYQACNIKCVFG